MLVNVFMFIAVPPEKRHLMAAKTIAKILTDNKRSVRSLRIHAPDIENTIAAVFTAPKSHNQTVLERIKNEFARMMPDYLESMVRLPEEGMKTVIAAEPQPPAKPKSSAEIYRGFWGDDDGHFDEDDNEDDGDDDE